MRRTEDVLKLSQKSMNQWFSGFLLASRETRPTRCVISSENFLSFLPPRPSNYNELDLHSFAA